MSDLVVEACDPRQRSSQITDLFARNGQPQFEATFERAYRTRAGIGLRSWLGQVDGQAVMHVSVSPVRFRLGDRSLLGGVMGDLMVEEAQRDFWAPVRLLRSVVADLKREGRFDFLITTTTPDAEAVFKAAGYKPYGSLRRFVLPLHPAYLLYAGVRGRVPRLTLAGASPVSPPADAERLESHGMWRPEPTGEYYRTRLERGEFREGTWLSFDDRDGRRVGSALLATQESPREMGFADAFWESDQPGLAAVALAAARWARRRRVGKLVASILAESRAARELETAGYIPRAVRSVMLVHRLREVPPPEDLLLTGLSLSSW